MLVLTRKLNEQIRIGDEVTITVIRVKGNTVRLGIEAPRSTRVVRGELKPLDQDREGGRTTVASQSRPEASKRASSVESPTRAADSQTTSPLAAYMPSKPTCVTAELSA